MEDSKLIVSSSPHLHGENTTRMIMLDVIIALIPATVASVWLFGWRAAAVITVCVASCIASEYLSRLVLKRPQTVGDLSCVVTGLILALNLPATIPLWEAALGGVVAIVVAKQMFGGIGHNFVNPALIGRIVLLMSFSEDMNNWMAPVIGEPGVDAISQATPLTYEVASNSPYSLQQLFFGVHKGSLGETCAGALLIGGIYLVMMRVIKPT
ncbi:MAG: RnfABCDGE type electron transport complex subunit D, partial [Clostridia bacterium]|nr:RnfABCDGE type electron transport complex subunit D [Clostridia bacterium]